MTIISVAWTIYDERLKEFMNNCTGGGLVIKNICEYIGRKERSYLLLGKELLPELRLGNFTILKTLTDDAPEKSNNQEYLDYLVSLFEKHVINLKPDIVNFHGIGDFVSQCVAVCDRLSVPYVATNHLYIGKDNTYGGYDRCGVWEDNLYLRPDIQVITVSTGIKKRMQKDYPNLKDIKVILNGTDFMNSIEPVKPYINTLLQGKKVLVCVGTISERKNQLQVIDAFECLRDDIQESLAVLFCGNDRLGGQLQKRIREKNLEHKLFYCGALSSEQMKGLYSIADGLVMPSKAEGLSIAALEAIAYGLPVIMFLDSECAYDLNDERVVCFAKDRNDASLGDAINEWFNKDWNLEYIRQFSKNYTLEHTADEYIKFYKDYLLKLKRNLKNERDE